MSLAAPPASRPAGAGRRFAALVAALGWGTFALNTWLGISSYGGLPEALWGQLWYFTIWTNILCAAILTGQAIARFGGRVGFSSRPTTATGGAAAIIIVGVVYNLLLRQHYDPDELGWIITNEMFHVVLPVLFVADWVFFVDKRDLSWRVLSWVSYPALYMAYALVRGLATDQYPYPFADVNELGYGWVLLNAAVIGGFFALVLVLLLLFGRRRRQSTIPA